MSLLERWRIKDGSTATRPGRPDLVTNPPALATRARLYRAGFVGSIDPGNSTTTYVLPGQRAGARDASTLTTSVPSGAVIVDPYAGSDSNDGTSTSSAVQSLSRANALCPTGGTIVLRGNSASRVGSRFNYHDGVSIPLNGTGMDGNALYACVPLTKANITVQPYPGETPIFDGSTVQTGWTQSGSTWSKALAITLDRSVTDSYGKLDNDSRGLGWLWTRSQKWHDLVVASMQTAIKNGAVTAAQVEEQAKIFPLASWTAQVWINDVRQVQVATLAEVVPGTFYVEGATGGTNGVLHTSSRYHIGSDPTGKEVRVADRATAFATAAANITVKGVKVRRYAGSVWHGGVVKARSAGSVFEDVIVEDAMVGFEAYSSSSDGVRWTRCETLRSGVLGWKAHQVYNVTWDRCASDQANFCRYNWAPVSGGIKITAVRNFLVTDCRLNNGWTKGFWDDVSCYDGKIVNTDCSYNEQFGMVFEIGAKRLVANVTCSNNGKDGILVHDTHDTTFWHFTAKNNGQLRNKVYDSANPRNIKVYQDNRRQVDSPEDCGLYPDYGRDSRQPTPDPTINNFLIEKLAIYKTITEVGNLQFAYYGIEDLQKNQSCSRDISEYHFTAGANLFRRVSTSNPSYAFLSPGTGQAQTVCFTLSQWRSVSGQDGNSVELIGGASPTDASGILTASGRLQYAPGNNGMGSAPLPSAVASLIGVPVGDYAPGPIPIPV